VPRSQAPQWKRFGRFFGIAARQRSILSDVFGKISAMTQPQRVMVIGSSGSGKSTISRKLAKRYQLPLVHLDHHFWQPGWIQPSNEEWDRRVRELIAQERWLHDGNYSSTMSVRLERADLVVFLDMNRSRCVWRVLSRFLRGRQDIPGCDDRVQWQFLRYIWRFPRRSRPRVLDRLTDFDGRVVRLRRPREVRRFLAGLSA